MTFRKARATAMRCFSLDRIAKNTEPAMKRIIINGSRKVDRMKVLLRTRVRYSLFMIRLILRMVDVF